MRFTANTNESTPIEEAITCPELVDESQVDEFSLNNVPQRRLLRTFSARMRRYLNRPSMHGTAVERTHTAMLPSQRLLLANVRQEIGDGSCLSAERTHSV